MEPDFYFEGHRDWTPWQAEPQMPHPPSTAEGDKLASGLQLLGFNRFTPPCHPTIHASHGSHFWGLLGLTFYIH